MAAPFSEDELIARYFAPMAGPGALGLRDDAALLSPPPGCDLVLTKDAIVASVHFFADDPPGAIARKALRVNLSDLAAKGAEPLGFLLALALTKEQTPDWLAAFAQALSEDAALFRCSLLGGDTVKTPGALTISITALGSVPAGRMVPRTGAKAGDFIYVSGTIGDAALGLQVRLAQYWADRLETTHKAFLRDRYLLPQPRQALAPPLRDFAHGAMDISDGLVGDCAKMLRVSGVTGEIDLARMPLSEAAAEAIGIKPELFDLAVTGGDDYEILCTVAPEKADAFEAAAHQAGISVTRIGIVREGQGAPVFRGRDGALKNFAQGSYAHF
jgi:thiamine-monophosphate kinase